MLVDDGAPAPEISDAPPAVGGPQTNENEGASGTTPRLPGWIGQLTKEQQAEIQGRVTADPKAIDELPKGLADLYTSYSQLKASSVGALKVPPKDAPKEVWDQFYLGLGRPESAEGYTLERPETPSGMRYDETREKWFKNISHTLGLTNDQAKGFYSELNKAEVERRNQVTETRKKAAETALSELKQEWKDKFADNIEGMRQAYTQFIPGGQEGSLFKKIQSYGLDNDPDFLKMFKSIWEKIGPPKIVVPREHGASNDGRPTMKFDVDRFARQG